METREALLGNLSGGHAEGYILQNLQFRGCQLHILRRVVDHRCQQNLRHALTDIALPPHSILYTLPNLLQGRLLHQHTETGAHSNGTPHELRRQVDTEQDPVHLWEALVQDLQLFDVVNIEERIVEHHDGIARLPQSFDELRLVRRLFPCGAKTVAQVHQSCPCDILVVC